ncbi:MAG TPA: TRAP transporter substrate-binding protein [Candidatus Blautia gallistercoris]|uniref:TRAP transporter substrate-binding protein n=1 Tax=Candidatus Blautia gallistercoris TaxID=2838490 RepID=A0A9D2B253_9FIRM|nr:TRAP transporter substrate-binding protein [Candidatus Blautia gallistercoris]
MKAKKLTALLLVMAMTGASLAGCGGGNTSTSGGSTSGDSADSGDAITLQMGFVDAEGSPYVKGGQKVAELVEEATDGKIKINVMAGGSLGGERDMLELTMGNNLDIATVANSVLTNFIPEMSILDQAYLWDTADQAHAAVDGPVGDLIEAAAEEQGFHVIGYMESGFRDVFSTTPIQTIDDFKGVTIRTMENQYHQAAFTAFGAMPVAMAAGDQFTALQQGTIDACENAVCNCYNNGFYEVTKNITRSHHAFVYIMLCMSDAAWNKIPEDLREPFMQAVKEGCDAERQYLVEENESAEEKLVAEGVTFYDIDREALKAAYQAEAEKQGFTFDPEWEAAVEEAKASVN